MSSSKSPRLWPRLFWPASGSSFSRVASQRVRRRLGVQDDDETDLERVKRENAELRREIAAIKAERDPRSTSGPGSP